MKKVSSVVWKFFERIQENNRCVAVLCKLCDCQYKYFGNTTNLRVHLINKHPIQWELSENGTLDETNFRIVEDVNGTPSKSSTPNKRRKYKSKSSADKNIYANQISDSDGDNDDTTLNLVRQMHGEQQSDEEWLEEDPYQISHIETYEPQPKRKRKYCKIKREVSSPSGLPGCYVAPKPEKVIYEGTTPKDEYSVFGEYVANKLRKVRTPRTRGNLQQLITTLLWQAEYGLYDNADAVRRVLLMNVPSEPQHIVEYDPTQHTIQTEEVIEEQRDIPDLDHQSGDSISVLN